MIFSTTGQTGKIYRPLPRYEQMYALIILALILLGVAIGTGETRWVYEAEAHQNTAPSVQNRLTVIAMCESDNRHYDEHGNVLRGISGDIGIMQISPFVWGKVAERLGYDLEDKHDNVHMARWIALNDSRGFENWSASYDVINNECWRDK